ncbi:hypothetical protein EC988_005524 [Linderina pennispora]|nr:hypothetical protein EC988_005524 [Linderina pennispora]
MADPQPTSDLPEPDSQATSENDKQPEDVHMETADGSDDEYIEESYYVVANIPAELWPKRKRVTAEDGTMAPSKYAIIGLESDTPMLEIDGVICEGRHDELLGTSVVFEAEEGEENDDGDTQVRAEPFAVTSKVISFQTINIELRSK